MGFNQTRLLYPGSIARPVSDQAPFSFLERAMAQLPPKIPSTVPPTWPNFGHQPPPSSIPASATPFLPTPSPPAPGFQPSWVDEFLDFSSAKRSSHRRSASDSITFVEAPLGNEAAAAAANAEFDRLDDDQLMSMFPDDVPPPPSSSSAGAALPVSSSNPSTPSDHNSINDDKQTTAMIESAEEAQSACKAAEPRAPAQSRPATGPELIVDPKRVKR